jgi:hypothetical protein
VVNILRNLMYSSPLLMAELHSLLTILDHWHITLVPRYIRSVLNKADEFSCLSDLDDWSLRPHVHCMVARRALSILHRLAFTLDPFACSQSKTCPCFLSCHFDPAALALDRLVLD